MRAVLAGVADADSIQQRAAAPASHLRDGARPHQLQAV